MNSLIISKIAGLCRTLAEAYSKSRVGVFVEKAYAWVSKLWSASGIMSLFRRETSEKSDTLLSRIIYSPFTLLEKINESCVDKLSEAAGKSALLDVYVDFTHNMLALNTRFLGVMFLGSTLCAALKGVSSAVAVLGVAGLLLSLVNINITDLFFGSFLVRAALDILGLDVSYDFYDKKRVSGRARLISAVVVGGLCGLMPLRLAVILPIGLAAAGTVFMFPIVGVFAAVIAAPFVPTMVLAAICVLTIASLCVKSVTEKGFKFRRDSVGAGLGFFLIYMFVSCAFSFSVKKSILVWGMYFIFISFYFVIVNTVKSRSQLVSLLKVFAIAGLFVSIYGVLQYVFGWNTNNAWIDESMFEEATMRAYSTMENPNVLGEYLLLLIPISAVFFLNKDAKNMEKVFYVLTFLVAVLCMIFTQSRGCWLGLILAVAVFVSFYNGRLWALLPIAAAALIFLMPQTMIDRMLSVGNMEDSSTSYRVFIWMGTFELLKDFWIGGIGMGEGAFRSVYPLYSYNGIIAPHSHNTFLQLLVEGGIGALLTFVVIMIDFLRHMGNVVRGEKNNSSDKITALALGSAVSGFLLQSMFDYTFYNYRMMAMFFMAIAMGMALVHIKGEQDV